MNTKNTKTAVIILLIIANIFFIYSIMDLKIKSENIPSDMIDDAISILGKKGFIIEKSKIPVKKPVELIYEGVYSQSAFDNIVKYFSEISDEELAVIDYMPVPVGISCTEWDYRFTFDTQNFFKIGIMETTYIDAEMDFKVLEEETDKKIEMISENGINDVSKSEIKQAENTIKNFIKKYRGQDVKLGFDIIGFTEDKQKNCECVLIKQTVDGLMVDSHTVYIEIQDGKVKYFSGEWYFGEFIGKYTMPLLDSVNILFKCMETDENIIQESGKLSRMDLEYTVMQQGDEKFYLIPSWSIIFDSGKKLSYNMIIG